MNKITGNELLLASSMTYENGSTSISGGIPIRLHIAAMIEDADCVHHFTMEMLQSISGISIGGMEYQEWYIKANAAYKLKAADALIAAYNNTPNPNDEP
jgi:hypothetical protein